MNGSPGFQNVSKIQIHIRRCEMKGQWAIVGSVLAVLLLALAAGLAQAQGPGPQGGTGIESPLGTAFTYQGQLKYDGSPVNGNCDFLFTLWDTETGGNQIGPDQQKANVPVTNGYFTVELDFGDSAFQGDARWLEIAVRQTGGFLYVILSPRQPLLAAPYALSLRPGAYVQGALNSPLLGVILTAYNTATTGYAYGVWGRSESTAGRGVYGAATATSGEACGVYGWSKSTAGSGVSGWASAKSGDTYGVWGQSDSTAGIGVFGWAYATTGSAYGVVGRSDSTAGRGVSGVAAATSGYTVAVYGRSQSPDGYGGYFVGNVHVTGNLSVGGSKAFQIDHPLDPAGRYLYHFAVESPEVRNMYEGVVTLDARGEAVVTLPAYFSALNAGPFRYQLTAIGAPMPNLHIAQEIQGNAFRIAGGVPGKKVSWEVTAVRNDPYVRDHPVRAEVDKPAGERGTYLYPEGYGQPRELGLDYQRDRGLFERPGRESLPSRGE